MKKFLLGILTAIIFGAAIFWGVHLASAGPSTSPGVGSGAISANNGNLGVGANASATAKFYVVPTSTNTYAISAGGVIQGTSFSGTIAASNVSAGVFASGNSAFQSALGIGTNSTVGLPANGLYVVGNVGIGTSTPQYTLSVPITTGVIGAYSSPTNYGKVTFYDGSGYTTFDHLWVTNSGGYKFQNGGSDLVTILGTGNVGIGSSTPGNKLVVAGTIQSTSGGFKFPDGTIQTTAGAGAGNGTTTAANVSAGAFGANVGGGNYSFPGNVGIGTSNLVAPLVVQVSGAGTGFTNDSQLKIQDGAANAMEARFGVNTSGLYSYLQSAQASVGVKALALNPLGGNVGIGTTTPQAPFTLLGGELRMQTDNTFLSSYSTAGARVGYLQWNSSNGEMIFNNGLTGGILFSTPGAANAVFVANNGAVGIGTTAPATLLQVGSPTSVGNDYLTIDAQAALQSAIQWSSAGVSKWILYRPGGSADLRLYDSTDRVTFQAGGNVGIGTTTPSSKLDVTNGADEIMRLSRTGATYPTIFKEGTDSALVVNNNNSDILTFKSGKVGIGTTTPSYGLEVASGGATTARFGTAAADTVIVGGGTGKINVGTVDPVYTINGKNYATYLPGMTGQKEETTGIISCELRAKSCERTIDFNNLDEGSDLWLFSKATNLVNNFSALTVLLTPGFDGKVWYTKDSSGKKLIIHAALSSPLSALSSKLEVSYRLTAPRFDSAEWTNYAKPGEQGFNLDELFKY